MPLPPSIVPHTTALARIVAGLFALVGLTGASTPHRIARELHRAIALTLRPAESAVRRLIVLMAKTIKPKPQLARPMPANIVRTGSAQPRACFQLFDPRPAIFRAQRQRETARAQPRISFFGAGEVRTISLAPAPRAKSDGLANAAHLVRRLQALKGALDNLPRQAQRLLRAMARRAKSPGLKLAGPLRPGRAPGWRQRPLREIDHILHRCDWLARETLPLDTS